jgi:hypothetical protein
MSVFSDKHKENSTIHFKPTVLPHFSYCFPVAIVEVLVKGQDISVSVYNYYVSVYNYYVSVYNYC